MTAFCTGFLLGLGWYLGYNVVDWGKKAYRARHQG